VSRISKTQFRFAQFDFLKIFFANITEVLVRSRAFMTNLRADV